MTVSLSKRFVRWNSTYGLSEQDMYFLAEHQNWSCAVCHSDISDILKPDGGLNTGVIDHDHETGFVRGILCRRCNLAVGSLTVAMAQSIVDYLDNPPAFVSIGTKSQQPDPRERSELAESCSVLLPIHADRWGRIIKKNP